MNLYIQIKNNAPVNHPAFEENLIQAFGSVPDNWKRFVRVEMPTPSVYEVLVDNEPTYQMVDGVWMDVWATRTMTTEEKLAKQEITKNLWAQREYLSNFTAWVFDEALCEFVPPTPQPSTGVYRWSGPDNAWKETPPKPTNDKAYNFDFFAWQWVQVV